MAELKREYVVPLRRKIKTAPKWRRSKKAVSVLKDYIRKHMKTERVIICAELNEHLWERGSRHPPGKVSVIALKSKFGNEEGTLVNLSSVGLSSYLAAYNQTPAENEKTEAKDVIAKEVEAKETPKVPETKLEEEKEETKEKPKKKVGEKKEDKKNG